MVRLQPVEQRSDNRHAADATRLEIEPGVLAFRRPFQFVGIFTEQFFVGGDDRFPRVERGEHEFARRVDAADDFDDDIHVGIADNLRNVRHDFFFGYAEFQCPLAVEFENAFHRDIHVLGLLIELTVLGQNFVRSAADYAESEYCNTDFFHFVSSASFKS